MVGFKHIFVLMFALGFATLLSAQDTVKIQEVPVYGEAEIVKESQAQKIDSLSLMDPSNKDLGATLQKYSHAFVKSYGIGSSATVSLRGSGSSHTNLLWNGIQLNSSSHGVADLSLYPPFFTEEVSVVYGQNSNQYGSGGLGGAVTIGNKVQFNQEELFLQQQLGSFGYSSTALRIKAGGLKFQSVSRLLYTEAQNDFDYTDRSEVGFPTESLNHAQSLQRGFLQSFHYRIRSDQRLDVHIWYLNTDRELPAMMALKDLQEQQQDESLRLQAIYHKYFKHGKLSWNSSFIKEELIYDNRQLSKASISDNRSFRNFLKGDWSVKEWKFNFRMDLDWEQSIQADLEEGSVERQRQAVFMQIERALWKGGQLSAATRQEWVGEESFFLPQIRIDQSLFKGKGALWLMVGENSKVPSLNDLYWSAGGNQDLKAERSQNLEVGQMMQFKLSESLRFKTKVTAFYAHIDDYIQWVPTARGFWMARNLKKVESKGIESAISLEHDWKKWKNQLSFLYNYTSSINLQKNHAADASVGKQLIYVPEHQYNLHWTSFYKQYLFEANLQFVGARYLTSDQSDYLPYNATIDLSLVRSFDFGSDRLKASLSVRNLMDVEYQAIQWRPMPGRNYMISLNYTLR